MNTTLKLVTAENAPLQLKDFITLPDGYEKKSLFSSYKIDKTIEDITLSCISIDKKLREILKEHTTSIAVNNDLEEPRQQVSLEFGFGTGENTNLIAALLPQNRVYAFDACYLNNDKYPKFQKTLEKIEHGVVSIRDDRNKIVEKERAKSVKIKERLSKDEIPCLTFTPLPNVELVIGEISNSLYYVADQIKKNEYIVTSIILDLDNESRIHEQIILYLAKFIDANTIILSSKDLSITTEIEPLEVSNEIDSILILDQNSDELNLRLDLFIEKPPVNEKSEAGNNILHFNSKDRNVMGGSDKHSIETFTTVSNSGAEVLYSDAEIISHCIEKSRIRFADLDINKQEKRARYYLEFGFCTGRSLNFIGSMLNDDERAYGFDSGKGLPEFWRHKFPQGMFRYTKNYQSGKGGKLSYEWLDYDSKLEPFIPFIPNDGVTLIIGLIQETLQVFKNEILKSPKNSVIPFIFIDTDLKSSAEYILESLVEYIDEGTIILFDEAYNFVGTLSENELREGEYKRHEFSALNEFSSVSKEIKYEAININGQQIAASYRKG